MTSQPKQPRGSPQEAITMLSEQLDLIGLRTYIAKRTKYGRKAGREAWEHTRAYLADYSAADPAEIIEVFEAQGAHSDIEAGRWLLIHDELVP